MAGTYLREGLLTAFELALVGLLPVVNPLVLLEGGVLDKSLIAILAIRTSILLNMGDS